MLRIAPRGLALLLSSLLAVSLLAQEGAGKEDDCPNCEDAPVVNTTFVEEFESLQRETMAEIVEVAQSIPAENYGWKPDEESPSVLELLAKIAKHNFSTARFLRQKTAAAAASTKDEAIAQVEASFEAMANGVGAFPPGTDAGDIQVDTTTFRATMRELLMKHVAWNTGYLGQLKVYARLTAEDSAG